MKASELGEVPVGALLVRNGEVIGQGYNRCIGSSDATAHAEINALRKAGKNAGNYRLPGSTLYVTLEPCIMCAGAIIHSRVETLVYACADEQAGAAGSACNLLQTPFLNHRCNIVAGILEDECSQMLKDFFANRR